MKISYKDFKHRILEAKEPLKKVSFTFGRFNPVTTGHLENIDFLFSQSGDHFVFVSHSEDEDKNPLSVKTKLEILKVARPDYSKDIHVTSKDMPSVIQIVKFLEGKGYNSITMIVGSDRVETFKDTLSDYKSNLKELNVLSSGNRSKRISASLMREYAVNGEYKSYKHGMGSDVPEDLIKKSYDEIRSKLVKDDSLREDYISGKLFKTGSIVKSKLDENFYEVIDRGSNFVRLVDASGNTKRSWLEDISEVTDNTISESFNVKKKLNNQLTFKGYTTKHFNRSILESFNNLLKSDDVYAVLSSIKHTDQFFQSNDLVEKYDHFNKSGHYLESLKAKEDHSYRDAMESILAEKIIADIPSIKQITKSDKLKTANIIISALGIESAGTPEEKINAAAKEVSKNVSSELREIYGSLFQLADDVGIEWDKEIFSATQQRDLGLIESHNFEMFLESLTESIKSFNDIIPVYMVEDLIAIDENGNESELDPELDIEDSIKSALKINPLKKESPKKINVKSPSDRSGLERKAKNLALRYLRDRQLRNTLHKMSDKERNKLEDILSKKGSVITNATKKLIDKLEKIESERLKDNNDNN